MMINCVRWNGMNGGSCVIFKPKPEKPKDHGYTRSPKDCGWGRVLQQGTSSDHAKMSMLLFENRILAISVDHFNIFQPKKS